MCALKEVSHSIDSRLMVLNLELDPFGDSSRGVSDVWAGTPTSHMSVNLELEA